MAISIGDRRAYGNAVLSRIAKLALPKQLVSFVDGYRTQHDLYIEACDAAEDAEGPRDDALEAVAKADASLDKSVDALARKLTGAGVGARTNPFEGLSNYPPRKLTELAFAKEAAEVITLVGKVKKLNAGKEVNSAAGLCGGLAAAVNKAIDAVAEPQTAYERALGARDALLPAWTVALERLKKNADAAWVDSPSVFKTTFAPAPAVATPKTKRAKKASAQGAPPVAGGGVATTAAKAKRKRKRKR